MKENSSIVNLVKEIVEGFNNAKKLTEIFYGTVSSIEPLIVEVSNDLVLTSEFLTVPKILTNFEVEIEIDTATEATSTNTQHTHEVNYLDTTINGGLERTTTSEIGSFDNTHTHEVKGTKTITIYNALKVGEKVILQRVQGGQDYIILDRVG